MNRPRIVSLPEHIVEIVSDAGEGAQKAAVAFARLCAKTGNGLWTVEIIPSEIRPPPHTIGSASGNRIRLAERSQVTNAGDLADVVLAFNEMALLSRLEAGSLADDVLVLIDDQWATHDVEEYRLSYREVLDKFRTRGATIIEIPLQEETLRHVEDGLEEALLESVRAGDLGRDDGVPVHVQIGDVGLEPVLSDLVPNAFEKVGLGHGCPRVRRWRWGSRRLRSIRW